MDSPTIIGLCIGNPISMRPLKEKDLEEMIIERKKVLEADSKK